MKIVDLSQTIQQAMEVYPGDPEVQVEVVHTLASHTWELRKLTLSTHTGTHVDAFSHMHAAGQSIDKIPLDKFFGKAVVTGAEAPFPTGVGLFFTEEAGVELFPGIKAATPPFVGGKITEALERALLKAGIVTYTDLVNLEQIPLNTPFMFYGFPLKIKEGDGSPVRAVAVLEE